MRAAHVLAVLRERLLEGRVDAAAREIGDATERRDGDPRCARAHALVERARVGRAAVADARMVPVLDGADRDAAHGVVTRGAPAVGAAEGERAPRARRSRARGRPRRRRAGRARAAPTSATATPSRRSARLHDAPRPSSSSSVRSTRRATTTSAPAARRHVRRVASARPPRSEARRLRRLDPGDGVLDHDGVPASRRLGTRERPSSRRRGGSPRDPACSASCPRPRR